MTTELSPVVGPAGLCFAVLAPVLLIAHTVADHWVQTHRQSQAKAAPGWPGRRACAAHVASYTATTTLAVLAAWWLFALPLTPAGVAAGQVVSAVTHYWADRRTTLAGLARLVGKHEFYLLGTPRPGRNDNPSIGTGAYALDQAWHWLWLGAAAALTAVIAAPHT